VRLMDAWEAGPRTYWASMTCGFPNLFIMNGPHGISTVPNNVQGLDELARHTGALLAKMRQEGKTYAEPTKEAEEEYSKMLYDASTRGQKFYLNCTPGWMNNEGKFNLGKTLFTGYPGSATEFAGTLEKRRQSNIYEGLLIK